MSANEEIREYKTIFFNNVGGYSGSKLGKYFSRQTIDSTIKRPTPVPPEEEEPSESQYSMQPDHSVQRETGPFYKVIGATKNQSANCPEYLTQLIKYKTREELLESILECDVIVYDITENIEMLDEASWLASSLHAEMENFDNPKVFILLSTVLTWAKTSPLDEEDAGIPFTEEDFRRRKAHRNFEDHLTLEKEVIKLGKSNPQKFSTYVVSCGLTYGMGEDVFHFLFKNAWMGEGSSLQCFGTGDNVIPTIHVHDVASVIQNLCESLPKTRYLVAVDDSHNTLKEIVETVSSNLSSGGVEYISKEDALLIKELKQNEFDSLLVDLCMEPVYIKEHMNIDWTCQSGLVANMPKIVKEYRDCRQLVPMRVCVVGPPSSGKSELAKRICEHYRLHHIHMREVIEEARERLGQSSTNLDQTSSIGGDYDDDLLRREEDNDLMRQIRRNLEEDERIDDKYITQLFRDKLLSMPCRNQGYVLDGFPKTITQASTLFAKHEIDDNDEDVEERELLPEVVISLDASSKVSQSKTKEFIFERLMNLDEKLIQGTHHEQDGFQRRWEEFVLNAEEDVLQYFNKDTIKDIDITQVKTIDEMMLMVNTWLKEPRNYGVTAEEKASQERAAAEARIQQETKEREEKELAEAEEANFLKQRKEEWMNRLEGIRRQEMDDLEQESIPMRKYMMEHVMPTLTKGLIECCKERPENPIDFLAEYIFKNNPDVNLL